MTSLPHSSLGYSFISDSISAAVKAKSLHQVTRFAGSPHQQSTFLHVRCVNWNTRTAHSLGFEAKDRNAFCPVGLRSRSSSKNPSLFSQHSNQKIPKPLQETEGLFHPSKKSDRPPCATDIREKINRVCEPARIFSGH